MPVRHRTIGAAAKRDAVAAQCAQQHVPDGIEPLSLPITPPLRRDICAVTPAACPPTGPTQALLDILQAGISR